MITRTFYWPNEKEPTTEIEVTRDGSIFSALTYSPDLDCMLDCTQGIKERAVWIKRAQQFAADTNWNDHGDYSFETFKDQVASIIGVKPA